MLTRLQVNGFKNLLGFDVDLGPFTCIAGPNGTGKSNIFDAVRLLSLLADYPLMEAVQRLRGANGRDVDPRELFWRDRHGDTDLMEFTAEMIVPHEVTDDFGRRTEATITFLRYELALGYEPPFGLANLGRLVLRREELRHINISDAGQHLRFSHHASKFRRTVVTGRRAGSAFISTVAGEDGTTIIQVHQDGGSRGQPRPSPADTAPRTIVSTTTTSSDPTILAARREMQSWRMLALEPSAMRSSDPFSAPTQLAADGGHLPATLFRLATTPLDGDTLDPEAVYSRVAGQLAGLLGVRALRVKRDDQRQLLTLELQEHGGTFLPARSLSEGTLRFLALCVLREDPDIQGVICMEEPENGIHPERMEAMARLLRDLAVDASEIPGPDNPMRQVLINTHSPHMVQLQRPDDLLQARTVKVRGPSGRPANTLRLEPLEGTWRASGGRPGVGKTSIIHYLREPRGAQLRLEIEERENSKGLHG